MEMKAKKYWNRIDNRSEESNCNKFFFIGFSLCNDTRKLRLLFTPKINDSLQLIRLNDL